MFLPGSFLPFFTETVLQACAPAGAGTVDGAGQAAKRK
ncbi:hypothetical protein Q669_10770 [Labrenzia sp. C1B10]|nr:hypothetical protein Q669_10770 [Labrenzia sp. C1B10]ERS07545.1 hypothetical protein Q675_19405 [Labrenzia sp. C1B70]